MGCLYYNFNTLLNTGIVKLGQDNKYIKIGKASKYFFVTTQLNQKLTININNKTYHLTSAVLATAKAVEDPSAGGHYVALWIHKNLRKAFRLDSQDPDGTKVPKLECMEVALTEDKPPAMYGSTRLKQVYIYG